jgi:hypothetical protein
MIAGGFPSSVGAFIENADALKVRDEEKSLISGSSNVSDAASNPVGRAFSVSVVDVSIT